MKKSSKVLSVLLAVLMVFSIMPMTNIEAEAAGNVKSKLDSFISNYPSGSRWTGSFDGGIQCYGFGKMVIYNIFGKASNGAYRTWTYSASSTTGMSVIGSITSFSSSNVKSLLSNAKCGDVLQFNTTKQHTMIVYSVDNNGVTIYDCNWDNNCGISKRYCSFGTWSGRNSSKLTLLRADNYNVIDGDTHKVDSNYGKNFTAYPKAEITASDIFDANHNQISSTAWIGTSDKCTIHEVYTDGCCKVSYPLDGGGTKTVYSKIKLFIIEHTHSYSTYYEAAHPHKIYKKCSCGDWYYTGEYKTVSSCSSCQPPSGYHMWFDGGTKYYLYDTITVNAESNNAKQYQFVFTLPSGKDNYTDWMANGEFSATSNETGTYKVSYLAKNDYGTYDTRKDGCTLTFYYVAPTISISNSTSVSLKVGNTHQINLAVDTGDNDTDIVFSSSNTNVATVSSSGLITAKSSGTSTITAKLVYHGDNGDYTTSCKMTVSVSEKTYTVKFNANGGTGTMSNQSFTYNTAKALTANSFTRTGYTFLGWSTSSTATTATYTDKQSVKNLTSTDGGTVTLYAVWKPNTYTVKFNANGGTGTMSNQSFTYNTAKALTANSFTRTGYTFLGWSTSSTATTATYTDKQSVKNLTSTNGGTVTLYAVWSKNPIYTLSYNANGGTGAPASQTGYGLFSISSTVPTRAGYTFVGWSSVYPSDIADFQPKEMIAIEVNTTLYAVWKANTYNVKFNANGGNGTMNNQVFTYDTAKALSANSFTRDGYTFLGWSKSSTATSATYTDKQSVKNLTTTNGGYVTLYAVWQKDPVTVSSISIAAKPTKTEYYVGDTFNSSGLSVKVTMSDGTTKTLTSGFTVSGPNMSTTGTKTVTVTYSGKTATFTIKVIEKPVTPDTDFTFSIQEPSRIEIRNKDGIVLHTVVEGKLPDGARIEWSWDNNKFDVEKNDDGTLTIIARNNGETTITATVYGADGDILATDSVVMNSKSGFFNKIGGFFRSLFGTTKIYDK